MIVTVKGHLGPLHLMNTYSDENGSAIWYIEDHLEAFPDLGYMGVILIALLPNGMQLFYANTPWPPG
jgi:hypothetical protein